MSVCVLCLSLEAPCGRLWSVFVAYPGHSHLPFLEISIKDTFHNEVDANST